MKKRINITNGAIVSDTASVKQYLKETSKTKSLTKAQEIELAQLAQAGDTKAANKLVTANLRFVVQVARQYQGMGLELEDLIAFGNIGLFEAIKGFDTEKNLKFITFAIWHIRAEIQKALNDLSRVIRIPSHRTKTEEQHIKSIHTPVGDGENKETYADRYLAADSSKSALDKASFKYDLQRALSQLAPKQCAAIKMFYGIDAEYPKCMEQIAEELQVTGERARQLVRQAEVALSKLPGIKLLEQYL